MKSLAKRILTALFVRQARAILEKYQPKLIVVAGSVGKTSTKLAIAKVLSQKYKVQVQEGNYNVPLSVPFVITGQDLPPLFSFVGWLKAWARGQKILKNGYDYEVIVLEYGTDHPGEIAQFASLGQPDIAVVSGVAEEHMEFFETLEAVAQEELSVAKFSQKIVINKDDIDQKFIDQYLNNVNYLTYGETDSDFMLRWQAGSDGFLTINVNGLVAATNMIGEHSLKPLAAAAAVSKTMNLADEEIRRGLQAFLPPSGRMRVLKGQQNSTIIDDSYNSSPTAALAALKTFYRLNATKKIVLLGNMNELGAYSEQAHRQVGSFCDHQEIDLLVTLGKEANDYLANEAEANGCVVIRTESPYQAGQIILENIVKGSVVLAKGSQNGVFAEEAVKLLLANDQDVSLLVRQSPDWLSKKRRQFSDAV